MENNIKIEKIIHWINNKDKQHWKEIYGFAIDLAHEKNKEAFIIFEKGLEDEHELWREHCLRQIGYHYIPLEKRVIEKIKSILLTDSSEFLRLSASSVLSANLDYPDPVFIEVIKKDSDFDVKINCLREFLTLSNIEKNEVKNEINSIHENDIPLSEDYVNNLLKKYNY